jgi:hypothetical protein
MGRNQGTEFEQQVMSLARDLGWHVAHFRSVLVTRKDGSRYYSTPVGADGRGFPDLVLVKHRVLYRECKRGTARLEPDQARWGDLLTSAGADWGIWRDTMWKQIKQELTEGMR